MLLTSCPSISYRQCVWLSEICDLSCFDLRALCDSTYLVISCELWVRGSWDCQLCLAGLTAKALSQTLESVYCCRMARQLSGSFRSRFGFQSLSVALSRCRSGTNSGTFGALKCESDVRGLGQTTQLAGALVPLTSQARNQVCNVIACDSVLWCTAKSKGLHVAQFGFFDLENV